MPQSVVRSGGVPDACRVPTLEGEADVRVRPGTQPGDRLRMRGYGIPHVHNPSRKVRTVPSDPQMEAPRHPQKPMGSSSLVVCGAACPHQRLW